MRILRAADHRLTRWKNGLGETREIFVEADPAEPGSFLWRVSMATVAADGPFSQFPGVDRTIAVMQGEGMRLIVDGAETDLLADGQPFRFRGEADVDCLLTAGTTIDLNAMSARSRWSHRMTRLTGASSVVAGDHDISILVFNAPAKVSMDGSPMTVGRFDAIAGIGRGQSVEIAGSPAADVFLIGFDKVA